MVFAHEGEESTVETTFKDRIEYLMKNKERNIQKKYEHIIDMFLTEEALQNYIIRYINEENKLYMNENVMRFTFYQKPEVHINTDILVKAKEFQDHNELLGSDENLESFFSLKNNPEGRKKREDLHTHLQEYVKNIKMDLGDDYKLYVVFESNRNIEGHTIRIFLRHP